jgi:C-terminal processing protease CtpA/Prc
MYSHVDVKYSRKVKNLYRANIPKFFRFFPFYYLRNDARIIYTKKDGYIYRKKIKPYKHKSYEPIFEGNIYLLIGNYTFSSAADFAAVFKDFRWGTLIGEETGGLATSYGDILPFTMPYSQLNFGVSHKYFVRPAGFDDGKGVLPDYEVKQTSADLKEGIDTVLEFTKNLIKKNFKPVDK